MSAISRVSPPLPGLFGDAGRRRRALWAFFAGAVALVVVMLPALSTMQDRGAGIIAFELAGSSARASEIVGEWGPAGRDAARVSLLIDYPYLLFYGLFLAGACTAVAGRWRRLGATRLAVAGVVLAWAALGAAAADALENAALLIVASEHTSQPWPGLALGFAALKFALSIPAFLYALLGWLATLGRRGARSAG